MDDLAPLYRSLKAAHEAGDSESAQKLADYIRGKSSAASTEAPKESTPPVKEEAPERGIGSTLLHAVGALPKSATSLVKGVAHAVTNPGETLSTANDALRGLAMKIPGADMSRLSPEDASRAQATGNALADDYGQTYGSWKGFKNKLATDPLGPILDISTVASGGAGLAGKVPVLGKTLQTVANVTNPLKPVEMGVNALASGTARVGGTVNDMVKGRGSSIAAGNIARDAAGADVDVIRAANQANPNAPSSMAAAGVSGDTYQALAARGTRPDMSAVASQLAKDESDLMTLGGKLKPPEKLALNQRIRDSKATLDSVNQNAMQAASGEAALNRMIDTQPSGVRVPTIPGGMVIPGVGKLNTVGRFANGALDLMQMSGKLKADTITKLSEGMATGKSANQLLATLPTAEQSKLLQLLQSNPHWLDNSAVKGSAQGVNVMNRSKDE